MNMTYNNNLRSASSSAQRFSPVGHSEELTAFDILSYIFTLLICIVKSETFLIVFRLSTLTLSFCGLIAIVNGIGIGNISFFTGMLLSLVLLFVVYMAFREKK